MKGTRQIELDVEQWWLAVESKVVIVSDWLIWLDAEYSEYAEYYTDLSRHVVEDGPELWEDQGQGEGWKITDISDWTGQDLETDMIG